MAKHLKNHLKDSIPGNIPRHTPEPSSDDWRAYDIVKRRIRKLYADPEAKIAQFIELLKL
ncbi:hypothetical protein [Desulfovermiculus halophilus]|jgi:hypothetical protein|uniref:hypothetical protein n=1 Tax=Desulfovermiculus halophilus TaxID=339722 RepID=UPI0012946F13|nr:hypothetical protein [Desulfovermiculus halophilus]